jgi:hypothetical protein
VELSLTPYFDNIGIVSNGNPTVGNLEGSGSAFSAQALAAHGARAGARIAFDGVPFTWPDVAVAKPDNVTASGQTLRIRGAGRILAFLLTAGWGPAHGTGRIVYADGSAQDFAITSADWWGGCTSAKGKDVVIFTPYRNQGNGRAAFTVCVYYQGVRLRAGQTVTKVILPDLSPATPKPGTPSLHIFAVTIH